MPAPSIRTCLWFDTQAEEAATFYVSLFDDARITHVQRQSGQNAAFVVQWEMQGARFTAINGGQHYKLSPAVSIEVMVDTQGEVDRLWAALLDGGTEMRCGWIEDRFCVSWQILPRPMFDLMNGPQGAAVMRAMLGMVKIDLAGLQAAAQPQARP